MRSWRCVLAAAAIVATVVGRMAAAAAGDAASVGNGRDNGVVVPVASAPVLDKVVSFAPLSLKTKGKSPEEAFKMLGEAVGVKVVAGKDRRLSGGVNRTVWEKQYPPVDFDLEQVNFWEAALRLGERALVIPSFDGYTLTVGAMGYNHYTAVQTYETTAMHVGLHAGLPAGGSRDTNSSVLTMEFLLDPRLAVYSVGQLEIQSADDVAGQHMNVRPSAAVWPGSGGVMVLYLGPAHGNNSISDQMQVITDRTPVTMAVFRGNLPAVVATASKRVEWAIVNGEVADQTPRRVGDWTITALSSHEIQMWSMGSGPERPDREFTLKVERMSDKAPPFPEHKRAIVHFEGSPGSSMAGVMEPTVKDPKMQEWAIRLVTQERGNSDPVKKVIVDVPVEVKEVVLPFEFKNVIL